MTVDARRSSESMGTQVPPPGETAMVRRELWEAVRQVAATEGPELTPQGGQFYSDGNKVFGGRVVATAVLDRVLHHAITLNIRDNSYRLKEKLKAGLVGAEEPTPIH